MNGYMNIHSVKSVEIKSPEHFPEDEQYGAFWTQRIVVHGENGDEFTLVLFAKDVPKLVEDGA